MQFGSKPVCFAVWGQLQEVGFEVLVGAPFDAYPWMTRTPADGVTVEVNRVAPGIAEVLALLLKEAMMAMSGYDEKKSIVAQILNAGLTTSLLASARVFG